MIIIQISQGRYRDLSGLTKDAVLTKVAQDEAAFLAQYPEAARYHQPFLRELEVPDDARAPWGHEWYVVDEDGRLRMHSAQYDSSG